VGGQASCVGRQGGGSGGVVASASVWARRLNARSGWMMGALTALFRQLGGVAEGM